MFQGIKSIVHGADHIANGMICQDAAEVFASERYGVAVVADGHGSAKYVRSDIGSQFAAVAAVQTVQAYMEEYERFTRGIREDASYVLRRMGEQFLARWTEAVQEHFNAHPLTPLEAEKAVNVQDNLFTCYGSTVLIAVMAEEYHYGMLIGDGGFVVVSPDGTAAIPIEDKNSRANYTSSICSRNAMDALTYYYQEGRPFSMCVSTDGLIKSFGSEEDFKDYHVLLSGMLDNPERCRQSLDRNLEKRTTEGSGDDISVAVVTESGRVQEQVDAIKACIARKREEAQARAREAQKQRLKAQMEQERKKNLELQKAKEKAILEQQVLNQKLAPFLKRQDELQRVMQTIESRGQETLDNIKQITVELKKNAAEAYAKREAREVPPLSEGGDFQHIPVDEVVEEEAFQEEGDEVTLKLEELTEGC